MDFDDTDEEAAFRKTARDWLAANGPAKGWFASLPTDEDKLQAARDWQRTKFEGGFACITWPKEVGGGGGTSIQQVIYNQEEAKYDVPRGYFDVTFGMCLPTLMKVLGAEATKRFIGPALLGEEAWCQLFSEPSAGSDLAGLRMRAIRNGDKWTVNGQKVWTSGAHFADYGLLLVRTSPDKPKHKGLTMFWIDMRSPGIKVQPIKQMSGRSMFNEVWFDDVEVDDSQRIGEVDDGWRMSLVTLMNERLSIGGGSGPTYRDAMKTAAGVTGLDGQPASKDRAFREKIAEWYVASKGVELTGFRTLTALSRGETPGPESSISKLVSANTAQAVALEMMDVQGEWGGVRDAEESVASAVYQMSMMMSPGGRLAGGTDEVLRNIVAERVLGLPGDIRVDKTVPFNKIPTS
ncbi:acyl-CoA dehydrogenase family protein [Hyphomonas sp.]|uniref:acyl-CoA dehydrogenase family protein n=1 Tax=Hyphomonas sp. TaxID=87 RepID=UPI0032D8D89D